jgi:hypothetical protein
MRIGFVHHCRRRYRFSYVFMLGTPISRSTPTESHITNVWHADATPTPNEQRHIHSKCGEGNSLSRIQDAWITTHTPPKLLQSFRCHQVFGF